MFIQNACLKLQLYFNSIKQTVLDLIWSALVGWKYKGIKDINFDILRGLASRYHKRPENKPSSCIYFYINGILKHWQQNSVVFFVGGVAVLWSRSFLQVTQTQIMTRCSKRQKHFQKHDTELSSSKSKPGLEIKKRCIHQPHNTVQ